MVASYFKLLVEVSIICVYYLILYFDTNYLKQIQILDYKFIRPSLKNNKRHNETRFLYNIQY